MEIGEKTVCSFPTVLLPEGMDSSAVSDLKLPAPECYRKYCCVSFDWLNNAFLYLFL